MWPQLRQGEDTVCCFPDYFSFLLSLYSIVTYFQTTWKEEVFWKPLMIVNAWSPGAGKAWGQMLHLRNMYKLIDLP